MAKFLLQRVAQSDKGTFGVLSRDDIPLCLTLEDPWDNNKKDVSCIPAGTYQVVPHSGARYKNVWRLENVPNRTDILIHEGNTIANTKGCLLVGEIFGELNKQPAILRSVPTLDKLRKILPQQFTLTIKDV